METIISERAIYHKINNQGQVCLQQIKQTIKDINLALLYALEIHQYNSFNFVCLQLFYNGCV